MAKLSPQGVTIRPQLASAALALCLLALPYVSQAKEPIRVGLNDAPLTLDARRATDATSQRLIGLLSFGLLTRQDDFTLTPAAATLLRHTPTEFIFQIKPLTFTDGTPLTPDWVKNYYLGITAPGSTSPHKGAFSKIARITEGPNRTLVFTLHEPTPFPWSLFTLPLTHTTPAGRVVGLGPYQVTDQTATRLDLLDPQGEKHPLTFTLVKDPTVRLLKLLNHEIDLLQDDIPLELLAYGQQQGLKALSGPSASYTYLGFNFTDPALSQRAVRQALAQAINLPLIRQTLLKGQASPADSLLLPSHPAFKAYPLPDYNPAAAKALLAQAGYGPNNPLELTLTLSTNPLVFRLGQVLQQQLAAVGVSLTLQTLEWASFYSAVQNGRAQLYIMNWVGMFEPDIYRQLFAANQTPPAGLNRGRVNNPEFDRLTQRLQEAYTPSEQRLIAADMQKLMASELFYLPLWRLNRFALMQPTVMGYTLQPEGGYQGLFTTQLNEKSPE